MPLLLPRTNQNDHIGQVIKERPCDYVLLPSRGRGGGAHSTLGLKTLRRIGLSDTPLFCPVIRSVSLWISCRISWKSVKRLPATSSSTSTWTFQ